MYPSHTHREAEDTRRPIGPTGSIPPFPAYGICPTAEPDSHGNHLGQRLPEGGQSKTGPGTSTPPFLTQAATCATRPSPTTHGSTTNTSPPAAVVEAEGGGGGQSPTGHEPSRSPLRSETPTKTPTHDVHLIRIGRRRIPGLGGLTGSIPALSGLWITPRRYPSHRNHLVNDFLSGQANGSHRNYCRRPS